MDHLPTCCDTNRRIVEPSADGWPLAASACCRHSWAAPKRCGTASPRSPLGPHPCCCTGPFDLRASSSFRRARTWSLSPSAAFAAPRACCASGLASCSYQLTCKTTPSSHHCSLLPLGLGLLLLQPIRQLGSGGDGGITGERRASPLSHVGPPLSL